MRRTKISTLAVSLMIAAGTFFTGCSEESDTMGPATVELAVNTTSSDTGSAAARLAAVNDLTFTSGKITIREVVFDGDNGSESVSRTIEQIAEIDYATGQVTPEIIVEVPAGEYTSVNLGIEMQDDGDEPSTVIEGTYVTSSGESLPIRFEFNSGEVFEANAVSVTIPAGSDIVGKITFDALAWFTVVTAEELDNAALTDGVIVISETSNPDIFDIVADRLDVATEAIFE